MLSTAEAKITPNAVYSYLSPIWAWNSPPRLFYCLKKGDKVAENFVRRNRKPKTFAESQKDSEGLLPKQRIFVNAMLEDFDVDPGLAAERAGYKYESGPALLRIPVIQKAIKKRRNELTEEIIAPIKVDQQSVVSEMAKIAFSDLADFCEEDEDGIWVPKKKSELSKNKTAAIKKLIFGTCNITQRRVLVGIELYDKQKSLDSLAKHFGLFEKDNQQKQPLFNLDDIIGAMHLPEDEKEKLRKKLFKQIEQESDQVYH